jgi:hypothetical protein
VERLVMLAFPRSRAEAMNVSGQDINQTATEAIKACINGIFERVAVYIEHHHLNDYLANFSKNSVKCEALLANLNKPAQGPEVQTSLLDLLK